MQPLKALLPGSHRHWWSLYCVLCILLGTEGAVMKEIDLVSLLMELISSERRQIITV